MSILITGGHGMIGKYLSVGLKPTSKEMDITSMVSIQAYLANRELLGIIHLASLNLRACENDPGRAIEVNINGTRNMLVVAQERKIPFVFVSSGAVFSSNNSNMKFDVKTIPNPNCIYGSTKYVAENICLLYKRSIIIRTGWLFGGTQKNHYKFIDQAIINLTMNNEIRASNDFYGSFTYVKDFVQSLYEILNNQQYGIHQVVNEGVATGYEASLVLTELLEKSSNLVIPVTSTEVPNAGPSRGKSEILISTFKLRPYTEALKEYLEEKKVEIIPPRESKLWSDRTHCRLCDNDQLYIFYKLAPTPPANHYVRDRDPQSLIPLDLTICQNCGHIQLMQIIEPTYLYSHYLYVSSGSQTMINHLHQSVDEFIELFKLQYEDHILEIGANDGTALKYFMDQGYKNVIGVDPAQNIQSLHSLPIICDFFGSHLQLPFNNYKLIYAFHCCAHIENIKEVFQTVSQLLEATGIFVMEVGYFYDIYRLQTFDVVYHEHIDYHTCTALVPFGLKHGLKLFHVIRNNIQGGAMKFFFTKDFQRVINHSITKALQAEEILTIPNLLTWKINIIQIGNDMNYVLNGIIAGGRSIAGYGATAKLTTFFYEYRLSPNVIKYIIDDNRLKQNLLTPGAHLPIYPLEHLRIDKVDYIVIFAWNFATEIITKLEPFRATGLRIIVPFPEIRIL
jgi:dTDP-4-dehydrorhamnose reductase